MTNAEICNLESRMWDFFNARGVPQDLAGLRELGNARLVYDARSYVSQNRRKLATRTPEI